jgi:hypothetical protein
MKKLLAMAMLGVSLTWCGCGARPTGTTRTARAEQNQQVYEVYRQYQEAANQERQRAGLAPLPVKSYEEFRRTPGAE